MEEIRTAETANIAEQDHGDISRSNDPGRKAPLADDQSVTKKDAPNAVSKQHMTDVVTRESTARPLSADPVSGEEPETNMERAISEAVDQPFAPNDLARDHVNSQAEGAKPAKPGKSKSGENSAVLHATTIPKHPWESGDAVSIMDPTESSVVAVLNQTIEQLRKSDESSRHEREELLAALSVKATDFSAMRDCEDLRGALLLSEAKLSLTQSSLDVLRCENDEMKITLEKTKKELGGAVNLQERYRSELSNVHGELKALRVEKNKEIRTAAVEAANLKEELTIQRELLEAKMKEADDNLRARLKEQAEELNKEHEKALEDAKRSADHAKNESAKDAEVMQKDLQDMRRKAEEGESKMTSLKKDVTKLNAQLKESKKKEDETKKEIGVLKTGLRTAERELKKAETDLEKAQSNREKAEEQYKQLQEESARREEEQERAKAELSAQLQTAVARAAENTRTFTLPPSSLQNSEVGGLISPPPLRRGRSAKQNTPEDMASESRSRFTDNLPQPLRNERIAEQGNLEAVDDDEAARLESQTSPVTRSRNPTKKAKRSNPKPKRKRESIADEEIVPNIGESDTESVREQEAPATKAQGKVRKPPPKRRKVVSEGLPPRPPRKPSQHTKAAKEEAAPVTETGEALERRVGGRTLRSRKRVSYDYNQEGRDIVNAAPGYEVDTRALRKKPIGKGRRSSTGSSPSQSTPDGASSSRQSPARSLQLRARKVRQSLDTEQVSPPDTASGRNELPAARRVRRLGRLPTVRKSVR